MNDYYPEYFYDDDTYYGLMEKILRITARMTPEQLYDCFFDRLEVLRRGLASEFPRQMHVLDSADFSGIMKMAGLKKKPKSTIKWVYEKLLPNRRQRILVLYLDDRQSPNHYATLVQTNIGDMQSLINKLEEKGWKDE